MSLQLLKPSTSKTKIFIDTHHGEKVSEKFQKFYEEQKFLDIVLIAGIDDVKVKAHRIVISSSSDYFMAMFSSTLKETDADEIELQDIDGVTLLSIVEFIYSGTMLLHSDTVENVLKTADFLQMNDLIAACCKFMAEHLEISNCLGIALFAEQYNYTELYDQAFSLACENFSELCNEKEFLELDQEQLSKLIASIEREEDSELAEEIVFQSIVAWVKYDKANREPLLFELLLVIQYKFLTPRFIIENRHSVCTSVECYELILSWVEWHLSPETRSPLETSNKTIKKKNILLAFPGPRSSYDMKPQMFKAQLNWWTTHELPCSPNRKESCGMAVINEQLIIVGGKTNGSSSTSVECLNLETMQWTELPSMQQGRHYCGVVELNGEMYAVGGYDGPTPLNLVEKYDFSTKKWRFVAPLLQSMRILEVVALNGMLFAIDVGVGGLMQCYDPSTNEWSIKSFKQEASKYFGVTAVGGYLYALGGYFNDKTSNTVERYNPFDDTWSVVAPMEVARSGVKCAILNNRIVACGGRDNDGISTRVDEYNPRKNEWKELAPLLNGVNGQSKLLSY